MMIVADNVRWAEGAVIGHGRVDGDQEEEKKRTKGAAAVTRPGTRRTQTRMRCGGRSNNNVRLHDIGMQYGNGGEHERDGG